MNKYAGLMISIFVTTVFVFYTINGNEKIGNVLWFYFLFLGLLTLLTVPLVKNTKYAADRKKDKIPYSWLLSIATIAMSAMNGWFVIAFILAIATGSQKLK